MKITLEKRILILKIIGNIIRKNVHYCNMFNCNGSNKKQKILQKCLIDI